jgi:hypothetical protein
MDQKRNSEFLNAQITIAHWYLDHAEASRADGRYRCLAYAREAYDIVVNLLPAVSLATEQRERIAVKVANLGRRLERSQPPADNRDGADSIESWGAAHSSRASRDGPAPPPRSPSEP